MRFRTQNPWNRAVASGIAASLLCLASLALPALGDPAWHVQSDYRGTRDVVSQPRSLRGLALAPDDLSLYGGFIQGTTSAVVRKVRSSDIPGTITVGSVDIDAVTGVIQQAKGVATDDRGYVYATLNPFGASTNLSFRIYSADLSTVLGNANSAYLSSQLAGISVQHLGGNYYVYLSRNGGAATIERWDVTNPAAATLDVSWGIGGRADLKVLSGNASAYCNGLEVDPSGVVYVAGGLQSTTRGDAVFEVAADGLSLLNTNPNVPGAMDVTFYQNRLYVSQYLSTTSTVAVLDKGTLASVRTLSTGIAHPYNADTDNGYAGIDVSADGRLFVVDQIYDIEAPNRTNYDRVLESSLLFHTITASAGAGGSISPTGSVLVEDGADQTFTITASPGFGIADVMVDAVSQGPVSSYTFPAVSSDHTISATFVALHVHNLDTGKDYATIQAAISDPLTVNGNHIKVDAGTYPENVTLNKSLTLSGAQAGVAACGRVTGSPDPSTESIVTGPAPGATLLTLVTGSAGSTIDGFSFIGGTRGLESTSGPIDNVTIENSHFAGFSGSGVFLNDNGIDVTAFQNDVDGAGKAGSGDLFHLDTDSFTGFRLANNCIENNATGTGFFVDGNHNVAPSGRAPAITGNKVDNCVTGVNLGSRSFTGGSISGNTFSNNGDGATRSDGVQGGIQNSTISGNQFLHNGRWGLALTSFSSLNSDRGGQNDQITGNTFTDNDSAGYFISAVQFAGNAASVHANDNDIVGNGAGGGGLRYGAVYRGSETIDVACNWWGSADGPDYPPAHPNPGADKLFATSATYSGWLNGSIAGSPQCVQPSTTTLTATPSAPACGQAIALDATVSPAAATGSVDFYDGASLIGSAPVVAGLASFATTGTGGFHFWKAIYGGGGGYAGSTSNVVIQQVECPANMVSTVTPTPCDSLGWNRANMQTTGFVDIDGTYPHTTTGSLDFATGDASAKADFVHVNGAANLLSSLTALAADLYRNSSSTGPAFLVPAIRLLVDNGQATDRYSYLIWEAVYNGYPASFPTDSWQTLDLYKGFFWQRAFKSSPPNKTIEIYNRTLADWLAPGTVTDGGGNVSNVVGPNAKIVEYEIGVGSGWSGTFAGAADNFRIGFASADSVFNFETGYTITASTGSGGTVTPAGATTYACGADAPYSITPDPGYHILDVVVDGGSIGPQSSYTFHNVQADHTISATFSQDQYSLTIHIVGNGTVTKVPDQPTYTYGTQVMLTATADPMWEFAGWSGDVTSSDNPLTITMDGNKDLTATFTQSTAVLLSMFTAETVNEGIELSWRFGDVSGMTANWLERAATVTGPWTRLDAPLEVKDGVTTALDRTTEADHGYVYRMMAQVNGRTITLSSIQAKAGAMVKEFALSRLSPNPTTDAARIEYAVPREANVRLTIVDLQGRVVAKLLDGVQAAGRHDLVWNGDGPHGRVAAGLYFVRFESGGKTMVKRLALSR